MNCGHFYKHPSLVCLLSVAHGLMVPCTLMVTPHSSFYVGDLLAGSATQRTVVLKGLPTDVTMEQLEEKLPDAVQIIMPQRGTPATFPG